MSNDEYKSIKELIEAYADGQRQFNGWDFREDETAMGLNLQGIVFKNCKGLYRSQQWAKAIKTFPQMWHLLLL